MADKLPNVAVIGLGLIGSSIIYATQYFGAAVTVTGFDASKEVLLEAEKKSEINKATKGLLVAVKIDSATPAPILLIAEDMPLIPTRNM